LVECAKANGNVRLSELAVLAKAAAGAKAGTEIIEIGTFDGRTTLNLAANSAPACRIFTLDLLPSAATTFHLDPGEKAYVEKPLSGARFKNDSALVRPYTSKIVQLFGDSATFDWSAHFGKASLVFVDGSHTYQYVKKDTETAFKLAAKGGVIFWHDYGVWDGVTQALENFEACEKIGLLHIQGTSLVYAKVR
jgi:predicted O-methyltransferase YrrM